MSVAVVLLAAGRGERLGGDRPKAFVELAGRPLLSYALDTARACAVDEIVVTVPDGFEDTAREMAGADVRILPGGATRQESVAAAVGVLGDEVPAAETILVHDVARPLASPALFEAVGSMGEADGVVPALPVADTVKRIDGGMVVESLRRDELVVVQTPQGFRAEALERAHLVAAREAFTGTDDAMLLERIGCRVAVVPGEARNVKITTPEDLVLAAAMLQGGS